MKSNFTKFVSLAAILTIGFGLIQSCTKFEDIASQVTLVLDTDLLHHPLTVQYVNADLSGDIPENLEIEIIGQNKGQIFSILGSKDIDAEGNFVNLGIRKIDAPSPENPIEFTVITKADGFLTSHKSFAITNDSLSFVSIPMAQLGNDAPGISSELTDFAAAEAGVNEAFSFSSPLVHGKQEMAEITVPNGAKLYDQAGNQVSGNVEVALVHFDNREDIAKKAIPGGLNTKSLKALDGSDLGFTHFSPIGAISLDMEVNGKEVKTFSEPLSVTMTINPETINPSTKQPIQAGEEVVITSYNEETSDWQIETTAIVEMNPQGQLEVTYEQSHLSIWLVNVAPVSGGCVISQLIISNTDMPQFAAINRSFYAELVEDANPTNVVSSGFFRFYGGERVYVVFAPNMNARLRVYEGNELCKGALLVEEGPFNLCNFVNNIDLTGDLNIPNLLLAYVEISGVCTGFGGGGANLEVKPTLPIFYKDANGGTCPGIANDHLFNLLGVMSSGKGSTTKLVVGNFYDYGMFFGGINRQIRDIEVPVANTVIPINHTETGPHPFTFTETINVNYTPMADGVGQRVDFVFNNIAIPDGACEIWTCAVDNDTNGTSNPCDN